MVDLSIAVPPREWTMYARPSDTAYIRLLCFPYAGGGASAYRDWPSALGPDIEVWPIQLPGRENRFTERAVSDLRSLAGILAGVLRPALDERPYALFGHSMGAAIVFELARRLRADGARLPEHIFVAGHAAPHLTDRNPPAHALPTELFLDVLREYNGTSQQVFEERELLQAFLPTLRADFSLFETYVYTDEPPLTCPLSAFGGADDVSVPIDRLRAWADQTSDRFVLHELPGGHFFVQDERDQVWAAIREDLRSTRRAAERPTRHMPPATTGTQAVGGAGAPATPERAVAAAVEVRALVRTFVQGRRTLLDRLRRTPDRRERVAAVAGIDLRIQPGEIFGLLGPNGAGKTTTMRMLATLVRPTSGSIDICGVDAVAQPRAARALLGAVLGGERSVYWKLTGRENLEYFAALYQVARPSAPFIADLLATVGLDERADDYVERYSTGMRQRLALARSLLIDPPVLLLDEPTSGLDPQSSADLRQRISDLRDRGKTVLLATHDMEDADRLCDRVAIIDHGRVVALDAPAILKQRLRSAQVVDVHVTASVAEEAALLSAFGEFSRVAGARRAGESFRFSLHGEPGCDLVPRVVAAAGRIGATVHRIDVAPVTLEDVYLALTGRELRE